MKEPNKTIIIKGEEFKLPEGVIKFIDDELLLMQDYSLGSKERYEILKKIDTIISNHVQCLAEMPEFEKLFNGRGEELSMPANLASYLAKKNDYDLAVKQLSKSIKMFLEIYYNAIGEQPKTL